MHFQYNFIQTRFGCIATITYTPLIMPASFIVGYLQVRQSYNPFRGDWNPRESPSAFHGAEGGGGRSVDPKLCVTKFAKRALAGRSAV